MLGLFCLEAYNFELAKLLHLMANLIADSCLFLNLSWHFIVNRFHSEWEKFLDTIFYSQKITFWRVLVDDWVIGHDSDVSESWCSKLCLSHVSHNVHVTKIMLKRKCHTIIYPIKLI